MLPIYSMDKVWRRHNTYFVWKCHRWKQFDVEGLMVFSSGWRSCLLHTTDLKKMCIILFPQDLNSSLVLVFFKVHTPVPKYSAACVVVLQVVFPGSFWSVCVCAGLSLTLYWLFQSCLLPCLLTVSFASPFTWLPLMHLGGKKKRNLTVPLCHLQEGVLCYPVKPEWVLQNHAVRKIPSTTVLA